MKFLRMVIVIPTIIILGLIALVLAIPMFLYLSAAQIYARILKLICWTAGHHSYNLYNSLLLENLKDVRCAYCQTSIPEKDIPVLQLQREALGKHIDLVAQHLRTTKETDEITTELGKLEE